MVNRRMLFRRLRLRFLMRNIRKMIRRLFDLVLDFLMILGFIGCIHSEGQVLAKNWGVFFSFADFIFGWKILGARFRSWDCSLWEVLIVSREIIILFAHRLLPIFFPNAEDTLLKCIADRLSSWHNRLNMMASQEMPQRIWYLSMSLKTSFRTNWIIFCVCIK